MKNLPASFMTHLQLEMVVDPHGMPLKNRDDKQLYRVLTMLCFYSAEFKVVINVPAGFITDLDSTPRIPFVYLLMNGFGDMPAVVHDYLYSTGIMTRVQSDWVLREACLVTGVPKWKVNLVWAGVRLGGAGHYGPDATA